MRPTVKINGNDISDNVVSIETLDEYCNPGRRVTILLDTTSIDIKTWEEVTVETTTDGLVFTGNVQSVEKETDGSTRVVARDAIQRLRVYFIAENYTVNGEGAKYWIKKFVNEAGANIHFIEDYDMQLLNGMTIGRVFAWDAIDEILLFCGWDIWCDEHNVIHVGRRMSDMSPTMSFSTGDNAASVKRLQDSEPCRNKAMVYTSVGTLTSEGRFGWEMDDKDIRTMVVASPYYDDPPMAQALADRMVSAAGPTRDVKIIDAEGDFGVNVGQLASFDDGKGLSGTDNVTTVNTKIDGNGGEFSTYVKLGERCPKVGAGGLVIVQQSIG